jgi:hypothetical protein
VLLAWVVAPRAYSLPKLHIQPVELVGYAGEALRLSVELPCGSRFFGLVTKADQKSGTLKLAAAVELDSIVCTAMPESAELRIDYLATRGFKTIEAMDVDDGMRILVARISDLRVSGGGDAPSKLTAVYEPRCGRDFGTLIHRVGKDRLELAFVEKAGTAATKEDCRPGQKLRAVTALDMRARFKVAPLRDKPKNLSRAFTVRLAEVKPGSLRRGAEGGVSLTYNRACNEAPLGVVLSAPRRTRAETSILTTARVGVLVAHYDNFACDTGKAAGWTEISEPGLTLPALMRVKILAATADDDGLRLHAPARIARRGREVRMTYLAGCDDAFGVYARDWRGALTVGVLTRGAAARGGSRCKKTDGEVSLSQPYIADSVPAGELYPMQLKGLAVR